MLTRLIRLFVRIFWLTFTLVTVSTAVIVTLVRLLLPSIDQYNSNIETWLGDYIGQPVEIGVLNAEWEGWTPLLHLIDIRLLDTSRHRTITRFEEAKIRLDLLTSIKRLKPVPGQLSVSGIHLSLLRDTDGSITIEGIGDSESEHNSGLYRNALVYWLENQQDLSINSANITWHDRMLDQPPTEFANVTLRLRNEANHHQLQGAFNLPEQSAQSIYFLMDITGDLLTREWDGKIYLKGKGIQSHSLEKLLPMIDWKPVNNTAKLELWSEWQDARLITVDGDFSIEPGEIPPNHTRFLEKASGQFSLKRQERNRWALNAHHLDIQTSNGHWPESWINILYDFSTNSLIGNTNYLKLNDLIPILTSNLKEDNAKQLAMLPAGDLNQIHFGYFPENKENQRFFVSAGFNHTRINSRDTLSTLDGLQGKLNIIPGLAVLELNSRAVALSMQDIDKDLTLNNIQGKIIWAQNQDDWEITLQDILILHPLFGVELQGNINIANGNAPLVDILGNILPGTSDQIDQYFPKGLTKPDVDSWLLSSIGSGSISGGGLVFRGLVTDFPFRKSEGRFLVELDITDVLLDYNKLWPAVEDLTAHLIFDGPKLTISSQKASIFSVPISSVHCVINDLELSDSIHIKGKASFPSKIGLDFVQRSPLAETVGDRIRDLDITGPMQLDILLNVPFANDDVDVTGSLILDDVSLTDDRIGISLEKLTGNFNFTDDEFDAPKLQGQLFGKPIKASIHSEGKVDAAKTSIILTGKADKHFIHQRLKDLSTNSSALPTIEALTNKLNGSTEWKVNLQTNEKTEDLSFTINSNLIGMAIDLPAPLGKTKEESSELIIESLIKKNHPLDLKISIENKLLTEIKMIDADDRFELQSTQVYLGNHIKPTTEISTAPLFISGHLPTFDMTQWVTIMRKTLPDSSMSDNEAPQTKVDIELDQLMLYGQLLDNAHITAQNNNQKWSIKIDSEKASGTIEIPRNIGSGPIFIDFDHLYISHNSIEGESNPVDPNKIPSVIMNCKDFRIEDISLGEMSLQTYPDEHGLYLDSFSFKAPEFEINAEGNWLLASGTHQSDFNIQVSAAKLNGLLKAFNFQEGDVKNGETSITIDAKWDGSPADFELKKLNGLINIDISEGRFLDVDPKAGRLFALLSFSSLKRRLTLDFNDLFKKGFSFDKINGNFVIEDGDAFTNNMTMKGSSARIVVTGRTGLADQDYDQLVTVTPELASSIPMASALFGPIGAGVGAAVLAAEKIFTSLPETIDKLLQQQYTVTGSWDDPQIEQIKVKVQQSDDDASPSLYD